MSGLIDYFRNFISPSKTPFMVNDNDEQKTGDQENKDNNKNDNDATEDDYRLSLSSVAAAASTRNANEEDNNDNGDNGDEEKEKKEIRNLVSYKVWKQARNELISEYMSKRMAAPDDDDDDDNEEEDNDDKDAASQNDDDEPRQQQNPQAAETQEEAEEYDVPDNDAIDVPFWDSQPPPSSSPPIFSPDDKGGKPQQEELSTAAEGQNMGKNNNDNENDDDVIPYKIPHIDETTGTCTSIPTLDLYAKEIEFDLLKVEKVWGLRRTGRRDWMDLNHQQQPRHRGTKHNGHNASLGNLFKNDDENEQMDDHDDKDDNDEEECENQILPLKPFNDFEEDGPLGTLCKQVLSMEVTQLTLPTKEKLQQKASAVFGVGCNDNIDGNDGEEEQEYDGQQQQRYRKRRLRIFFYANYATQISTFLQQTKNAYNFRSSSFKSTNDETTELLLSLQGIPAKCILPFQLYPSSSVSWYDQMYLSDYCICIADTTNMKIILSDATDEGGQLTRVRFDSPISKIELALVVKNGSSSGSGSEEETTTTTKKQQYESHSIQLSMDTLDAYQGTVMPVNNNSNTGGGGCQLQETYQEWQQQYKQQQKEEQVAAAMKEKTSSMEQPQNKSFTNQSKSVEKMDIVNTTAATAALDENTRTFVPVTSENAAATTTTTTDSERNDQHHVQQELHIRNENDDGNDKMNSKRSNETTASSPVTRSTNAKRHKVAMEYLTLNDLGGVIVEKEKKAAVVNFFGVVLGFGCPRFTRSGDWMMTVWVVDESIPLPPQSVVSPDDGTNKVDPAHDHSIPSVSINIFVKERSQLPNLLVAGDVLRCHRLAVQMWNEEIQCIGRRNSSFVVVRPKANSTPEETGAVPVREDVWDVIPTAVRSFTFDQEDLSRANSLWKWGQERLLHHPTIKVSTKFRLADMKRQLETDSTEEAIEHGDLTVMVAAKIQVPFEMRTGVTPRGYLRVWDGTGPPHSDPLPIGTGEAHDSVTNGDPPSEALASIASTIRAINSAIAIEDNAQLTHELEPPKAVCGRVVNVAVWEDPSWDLVDASVRIGTFIRLRNVEDRTIGSGFRCLMAHNRSSLTPLPDKTFEIRALLKEHQMRIRKKEPINKRSGLLPLQLEGQATDGSNGVSGIVTSSPVRNPKFNTTSRVSKRGKNSLAHCIAESAGQAFSVQFRINNTEPPVTDSEVGLRKLCVQSKGDGNSVVTEKFQFALHISDDTAEFAVIVGNEVGECLLGMTAKEASNSSDVATEMLDDIIRRDAKWSGTVRSVLFRGFKYFTLESVSSFPIHENSW